ncbi:MAG: hypothetical protein WBQ75_21900, partial [Acetobacteraceae bacterium]
MRPVLLAGTSLLALALSVATASAGPTTTGTPGFYTFTVDVTGLWEVVATGAQGGASGETLGPAGGLGAQVTGIFSFTAGEVLSYAVGGMGAAGVTDPSSTGSAGGGGGGSFVLGPGNTPLAIA